MAVTERGRASLVPAPSARTGVRGREGAARTCVVGAVVRAASAAERLCSVEEECAE